MILDSNTNQPVKLSEQAEAALMEAAVQLGFLVTSEEADALQRLSESTALREDVNIVRLNRQAKLDGLVVRSALVIAQQKNDPLYAKYGRAAALKRQYRDMIVRKYGGAANMTARKLLANAGKRNLVDISAKPSTLSHPETRG